MKTPADKKIVMTFHSHQVKDLAWRWKMQLHFPPGAAADTVLEMTVNDGNGAPVDTGVLEFVGKRLRVRGGKSSLAYGEFIAGKHAKSVWLYRHGIMPVPGSLTFE